MRDRVFVLGAGRAGRSVANALSATGEVDLIGLHGRRAGAGITSGELPPSLALATAVLIAVRDPQLDDAFAMLAQASLAEGAVVLHMSGIADAADALDRMRARGIAGGTFHPLVPLSEPAAAPEILRGAWIGIDGDPAARRVSRRLAAVLGAHVLEIPAGEKPRYHAAAVIASNFPTVLAAIAETLLERSGIAAEASRDVVWQLMRGAVANLRVASPASALTGPIVRGDHAAVALHLAALRDDPTALALYRTASRAAVALVRGGSTPAGALDEIERLLERAGT